MADVSRWSVAQQYEQDYWRRSAGLIDDGSRPQFQWYRWRAQRLVERLDRLGLQHLTDGTARVVEVGGGPVGVVAFFPAAERIAVDPLSHFYASNPTLSRLQDANVLYCGSVGEALPCRTRRYDLAIMENCIDHVRDVNAVMGELSRVLNREGVLFLTVNCRTRLGFLVHRILSRLRIDAGHPHTFTVRRVAGLLRSSHFDILTLEAGSYTKAALADLRSPKLRDRFKAFLGVSEFLVTVVARRVAPI